MTQYRRYSIKGGCYFFTVNLKNRNQSLLVDHIQTLRDSFSTIRVKHPFTINAAVVLPEHLHCIWTLPEGDSEFSLRWRQIKSHFSRQLPMIEHRSESRIKKNERGVWQRRFWEHALRDDADFNRHVDYIHYNPVKHGYCERPCDWPYSSFHRFVKRRIYEPHWSASPSLLDFDIGGE